jgi:hypothetical protein
LKIIRSSLQSQPKQIKSVIRNCWMKLRRLSRSCCCKTIISSCAFESFTAISIVHCCRSFEAFFCLHPTSTCFAFPSTLNSISPLSTLICVFFFISCAEISSSYHCFYFCFFPYSSSFCAPFQTFPLYRAQPAHPCCL